MHTHDLYHGISGEETISILFSIFFFICLIGYIFSVILRYGLFKKMGIPVWKVFIPLYSDYSLYKEQIPSHSGLILVALFLLFIPYVNIFVIGIIGTVDFYSKVLIGRGFNKDFTWLLKTYIPFYGILVELKTYYGNDEYKKVSYTGENL